MKKRIRTIGIILYPDNPLHLIALNKITHSMENYIYILHDKDYSSETGEIKKNHYHVILHFENARTIETLSKNLGIEENLFYYINSFNGQLRYLIHYDDDDKTRYDIDEVKGTLYMLSKFKKSIKGSSDEVSEVSQIYEFIINNEITDLHYLIEYVIDNDLYASFRRNYIMFKDLLHMNLSYRKERKNND